MPTFDSFLRRLQARDPLPPLYPSHTWDEALSHEILDVSDEELVGASQGNGRRSTLLDACRAGLLLWNDDLEASHTISQGIEDATGSFWHAIMHRREGDPANSHYWWRRTGAHPAFSDVYTEAMRVLSSESSDEAREFEEVLKRAGTWVPMEFVARCELARRGTIADDWLRRVQVAEFAALLNWCRAQVAPA
jgi:hypothetical protein